MPTSPSPAEVSAAILVAKALDGSHVVHDDGTSDGQYDFRIETDDENHALEVTSMTDSDQRGFESTSAKLQRVGRRYNLRCAWLVKPTPRAALRIKKSMDQIIGCLERLEDLELDELPERRDDRELCDAASAAGIGQASVLQSWEPGEVFINTDRAQSVHAYPDDAVAEVVRSEAWKEDNRKKLAKSKLGRRHLFVEIDHSWIDGFGALNSNPFLPPVAPPELPDEVTDLWLRCFDRTWWWNGTGWSDVAPAN